MIKIVLDTSIILAALISKSGSSFRIIEELFENKIINFVSQEILEEYFRILIFKGTKYFPLSLVFEFYKAIEEKSILVIPKEHFTFCRDPEDNKFLDVVYESKAEYLITLDRDLLDLRDENKEFKIKEHRFKILRPEEFLEEINE